MQQLQPEEEFEERMKLRTNYWAAAVGLGAAAVVSVAGAAGTASAAPAADGLSVQAGTARMAPQGGAIMPVDFTCAPGDTVTGLTASVSQKKTWDDDFYKPPKARGEGSIAGAPCTGEVQHAEIQVRDVKYLPVQQLMHGGMAATSTAVLQTSSGAQTSSTADGNVGWAADTDVTLRLGDSHVTTLGGEMQGGYLSLQHHDQADDSSTFTIVPLDNNEVALKSKLNGKFLMVDQSTNGPAGPSFHLRAGASEVGPWEKFTLDKLSDGTNALKSSSTGKYVWNASGTLTGYGEPAQAAHIAIAPANPGFPLHPAQS
ncbi:hypothetical protein [Streptomyces sp. NPDC096030]|uniref:fascin domain-containing protein n=1 Tax=Streptomyces sp. NPDC096030 TaxID=3155423 RepID=UPI003319A866